MTCLQCRYYAPIEAAPKPTGQCYRYPPAVLGVPLQTVTQEGQIPSMGLVPGRPPQVYVTKIDGRILMQRPEVGASDRTCGEYLPVSESGPS